MNNLVKKSFFYLSRNQYFQNELEKSIRYFEYLIGVGSGTPVSDSGEKKVIHILQKHHAKGTRPICVFDVGANIGLFTQLLVSNFSIYEINIHAFEPSSSAYDALFRKFRDFSNIRLNKMGLGIKNDTQELYFDKPGSGLASLTKRRLDHFNIKFALSEKVKIGTLDKYCEENEVDGIDLLKIDVEGHELDVLNGGIQMFRDNQIQMVSFEFGGCNIDTRTFFQDYYYFFKDVGKPRIFRYTPSGLLKEIKRYREDLEKFRTSNYLVILNDQIEI